MDLASRCSDFNFWSWLREADFEKIAPPQKRCKIAQNQPKIEVLGSPGTLECSEHLHTVSTCITHEYYRFWEFQNRPTTISPLNLHFRSLVKSSCKVTYNHPRAKIEILDSADTLECSDHLHMVSTCETHEYYRLQEFQNRPTTFHLKNLDFGGGAEIKLT